MLSQELPLSRKFAAVFQTLTCAALVLTIATTSRAQDTYEIQVYPSGTVSPGRTMVELHSNFTFAGTTTAKNGVGPSEHALHETIEITHGFNDWFEIGFYIFTSAQTGSGWQWVGDHIRPRFAVPASWHWPVGVSFSQEFGYQQRAFSEDTWTWEIRPIVDQRLKRWYWSFNPTLERSFRGENVQKGFEFAPNGQMSFDVTETVALALEYYGGWGPLTKFEPLRQTGQQIYPAVNLNFGADWEFNVAVGVGLTPSTDHLLAKVILGRRFGKDRHASK